MKRLLLLLSALFPTAVEAGVDYQTSFSDGALDTAVWDVLQFDSNGTSALEVSSGALHFTAAPLDAESPAENASVARFGPSLEADRDFHISLELHNFMQEAEADAGLLLRWGNASEGAFATAGYIALPLQGLGRLSYTTFVASSTYAFGTLLEAAPTTLALSLTFDAPTRMLTIYQNEGGTSTVLGSVGFGSIAGTIEPTGLAPSDANYFAVELFGTARSPEITSGEIYFESLSVTQIPEPRLSVLMGALAALLIAAFTVARKRR